MRSDWEDLDSRIPEELRELARKSKPRRVRLCLDLLDRRLKGITVIGEAIHRRHNVSAILRSAEAFGIHEAHLVTNDFKPSVGAAKGAERWLELVFHDTTADCFAALRERGHRIWIGDLGEGAVPPSEVPVDRPIALLFGSELSGVSPEAREAADGIVQVPMRGVTQSLNVSVAAALTLHTVCERRRAQPGAVGIEGEARTRFRRRFLERERSRRRATTALWGGSE